MCRTTLERVHPQALNRGPHEGLKEATKAWHYEHCDMDPAAQCSKKFKFLGVAWIGMLFMTFIVLQSDFSFVNVAD